MRLPNGYGSVTKLSGNRRRPYMVKKTEGYNEKGHPIIKIIGYAETREQGLQMLAEYNNEPYDVDAAKMTTWEVIEQFKKTRRYQRYSKSTKGTYTTYIRKLEPYYNAPYRELKAVQMQDLIDGEKSASSQGGFRNVLSNLDDFAIKSEIITSSIAQTLDVDPVTTRRSGKIFTEDEIDTLWKNVKDPGVQLTLMLIYTGFRISELFNMKIENVDLTERTFKGGTKTTAGKDRIVPIHSRLLSIVEVKFKNAPGDYLLYSNDRNRLNYYMSKLMFDNVMDRFNMEHVPHDTRHTFRSRLDNAGANKTSIDLLMGHKSEGIGERVYTHKTLEQLRDTVKLLD